MKTKIISATTGTTEIIAGVVGKKLRVLAYTVSSSVASELTWKSATTAISGVMHMGANGNIAIHLGDNWPSGGLPVLETAAGESLNLTVAGTTPVIGGHLTYYEVLA
jgi:hypothetical protein